MQGINILVGPKTMTSEVTSTIGVFSALVKVFAFMCLERHCCDILCAFICFQATLSQLLSKTLFRMGNLISISIPCDQFINRFCNCFGENEAYIQKLKENVGALQIAMPKLRELQDDVNRKVNRDEVRGLQPLATVQGWISRVQITVTTVDQLLKSSTQEIQRLCLCGRCSMNCMSSYKYGKMVAKKLTQVEDLINKGNFQVVAERGPAPLVEERPAKPAVGLERMLGNAWSRLMEDGVGILGLYGMGGVGKTTLLTQINNKFLCAPNDFDIVIWVVVSRDVQIERIQEDIGKKLGLLDEEWKQNRRDEKASDIHRVLKRRKFILFLDDIWKRIDLTEIGIPVPDKENGCKVAFTTRSQQVCGSMEVGVTMEVKCLEWHDAWDLFQKNVGESTLRSHPNIPELAKIVAKKCCGLPLALNTIGRAMTFKRTVQEWRRAIDVLNNSASEFSGMEDEILPLLKFSYDNLRSETVKSCFLYCALFPEDFAIEKDELVDYWIGEGILDGYADREKAEDHGYEIIGSLVQACMLIEDERNVKMHDVIRELALWIASDCGKEKEKFIVQAGSQLRRIPEIENSEAVIRISLMQNQISKITGHFRCSNLLTLILRDNKLEEVSRDFFGHIPAIRVLDLSENENLVEVPEDISELVSLQYFNLSRTIIRRLPAGFKKLVKLKYLNLEHCQIREGMGVISSLLNLQILRLFECGFSFGSGEDELSVEALEGLKHLNFLSVTIRDASTLERFLNFNKLATCTRCLCLGVFESQSLDISSLASMTCLQRFEIFGADFSFLKVNQRDTESQVVTMPHSTIRPRNICFNSLSIIALSCCWNLRDLTWLMLAPNLTSLYLNYLERMEEIINKEKVGDITDQQNLLPFQKLKYLYLIDLSVLKSIYWSPLPFPCLKKVWIINCPMLKKLPLSSESAKGCELAIWGEESWMKEVEWEDEATKNAFTLESVF